MIVTQDQLIGLVRSLRPVLPSSSITINAVAPGPTETPLLPQRYIAPIRAAGLPVCTADSVGLALAYSATAHESESNRTDVYGRKKESDNAGTRRWNGKVIMVLGESYTELEGPYAEFLPKWLGKENDRLIKAQQALTNSRGSIGKSG